MAGYLVRFCVNASRVNTDCFLEIIGLVRILKLPIKRLRLGFHYVRYCTSFVPALRLSNIQRCVCFEMLEGRFLLPSVQHYPLYSYQIPVDLCYLL